MSPLSDCSSPGLSRLDLSIRGAYFSSAFLALAVVGLSTPAAGQLPGWRSILLSPRYYHAMAYDSGRGVTVLFGGCANNTCPSGDTWEWNGSIWTLRSNSGPSPRYLHAMAYDASRGVTVLFGGYNGSVSNSETWEWNGSTWMLRSTSGPSARNWHALAYDASGGVTVLFGGVDGSSYNNETWEWDGSTWTLRATSGPSPRNGHAMAYDPGRGVTLLFGGHYYDGGDYFFGDTWEWNGSDWVLQASDGPSPRHGAGFAYDAGRNVTVLFGGSAYNPNGETWEWNGSAWALRSSSGPSPRFVHAMAYDAGRGMTVLFGGCSPAPGSCPNGETWEWTGSIWTLHASDRPSPSTKAEA